MRLTICLFLLVAVTGFAWAEEEDPAPPASPAEAKPMRRGLIDGKFIDDYFGLVFTAKNLKKSWSTGGTMVVFSGACEEGIEIEISVMEGLEARSAQEILEKAKTTWAADKKTRTEMEEGTEPRPWALFVQESLSGIKKHHGYAFHARGHQGIVVHATIREKSETSGAALKRVIHALAVSEKSDSFLLAHLIAKQRSDSPTDPYVMLGAGVSYVGNAQTKNPAVGLRLLTLLRKTSEEGTFSTDNYFALVRNIALAQLTLGKRVDSVETWKEAIELAAKTSSPAASEANSRYNLACAYSLLKRLDEAFDSLEKAVKLDAAGQLATHAQSDPDLEAMRKDERWKKLFGEKEEAESTD